MSTNIVFTTSSGREFHSLIVRGKKEILQTYFFVLRITNLKGWFPRVFLSLVCFRWAATEKFVSSSGGFPSSGQGFQVKFLQHSCHACIRVLIALAVALSFSELPPAFENSSLRRDPMGHFHIRGLVGLQMMTQQPFAKGIACGNGFDIFQYTFTTVSILVRDKCSGRRHWQLYHITLYIVDR